MCHFIDIPSYVNGTANPLSEVETTKFSKFVFILWALLWVCQMFLSRCHTLKHLEFLTDKSPDPEALHRQQQGVAHHTLHQQQLRALLSGRCPQRNPGEAPWKVPLYIRGHSAPIPGCMSSQFGWIMMGHPKQDGNEAVPQPKDHWVI